MVAPAIILNIKILKRQISDFVQIISKCSVYQAGLFKMQSLSILSFPFTDHLDMTTVVGWDAKPHYTKK